VRVPVCLPGLDLFAQSAYLLFEGFPFWIGNQTVLSFRCGSILNDLVNRIVFGQKLEAVLLAPTEAQTVDDFGGTRGGRQIREEGDLLPVIAQKQNRAHRSHGLQTCFFLKQPIAVPFAFEAEPAIMKPLGRILSTRAPALPISEEADALGLEKTKGVSTVSSPVEYQREGLVAMHATDLGHGAGKGAGHRVVERLRKEEKYAALGIMQVYVGMTFGCQPTLAIPSLRRRMLAVKGAKVSVHVIESLPNWL